MHLHKLSRAAMPAPTVAWLRRVRVPLLLFGPCEQGREMDLLALHVPGLFPEERTTPLPSTENKESSSNAAAAVSDDVKVELTRGQRGAQTRACRNAERPEFVSCSDLGAGILPQSSLVSVLHKRPEWQDYKRKIRVVWKNDTRVAVNVTCAEAAGCSFLWHCTYFLQTVGHPAGTLLITSTGEHLHAVKDGSALLQRPAKLWTPRQEAEACRYMDSSEKGKRSAKQLQAHMLSNKHPASALPTIEQLRVWMKNYCSKQRRHAQAGRPAAAGTEVAPTQVALDDWPREGDAQEDLYVLEPVVVSSAEVFVPYTCKGMLSVLSRFQEEEVNLAVDAKMKVLEGGAGVATLSLLVKDGLRCTDLNLGAGRVQGKAFTSRAMPFVQATMHHKLHAPF